MSTPILNYIFNSQQLANPDGSLSVNSTGCTLVDGPGTTALGVCGKALSFGTTGKIQVNLPIAQLSTQKFCVRTIVKVDVPVTARQNLVESTALPFSLFLDAISGSTDFKAVVAVAPKGYGWSVATTEFATTLKVGVWYLIDLIYDTDTLGVAINGNVQSVHAFPDGAIDLRNATALYIGTWIDGAKNHFAGSMAALQIHNGIPLELEALLDERRNSPEWFISYKYEQIKSSLNLGPAVGAITYDVSTSAYTQLYKAGLMMYTESIGVAFEMHGVTFDYYKNLSDKAGLGYLVSDVGDAAVAGGRKSLFSKGGIYWSGGTGAVPVTDQIYLDYEAMGEAAFIGLPVSPATAIAGGKEQIFQGARMYHQAGSPKAHESHGPILAKFLALGGVSTCGYPTSNESDVKKDSKIIGHASDFENCTIYWSSGTGAFQVQRDIRQKYHDINGPLSALGFPTSDEQNIPNAPAPARCNTFQHGSILWFGSASNMFVCHPFKIVLGRIDTKEDEGWGQDQNDLYFCVIVDDNGHQLLNKRYPDSGDYEDHNVLSLAQLEPLPLTITPNNANSNIHVTFDVWESDKGAPLAGKDLHLGTCTHTLNAANAWGLRENQGIMNTGRFNWVNSITWSVQSSINESALSEVEKWWGIGNPSTPALTYKQYAAAFRDVDSDPEKADITDWLEKAFYSLVVKDLAAHGNCFGMALESIYARKHRSLFSMPLNRFTEQATIGEFNVKHQYQVGASAIWWFVGQFLSGSTHDPVDVFRSTRNAFLRGDNPVLNLAQNYDFSGHPHVVLPVGWDDSHKPWKLSVCDPNFPGEVKQIQINPDSNDFSYHGGSNYSGAAWSGGRMHYMPYCVLNEQPRTPIWDAILLFLAGTILILGSDAETESLTDENGVDLDAFGADSIKRLKAKKSLDNKMVSFKGYSGAGAVASEVHLRAEHQTPFIIRPRRLDTRLGANLTLGELARSGALPAVLQPLSSNPALFSALTGRDVKSVANDPRVLASLDPIMVNALKGLMTPLGTGRNLRHKLKGRSNGQLDYVVKTQLSQIRLNSPIAAGESHSMSINDLGTHSSVMAYQSAGNKTARIEIESKLGIGKDKVRIVVDKLSLDAARALQVNVKPGLGGLDILTPVIGTQPEVLIQTTINGKVNKHEYTVPFAGGLRIRPSTVLGSRDLKVGKIDALFGQLRDSAMLKPRG